MSYPDKEKREICWAARDVYWKCLDVNNDDQSKCLEEFKKFQNECPNTWVKHFIRKREYLKYKEKLLTDDPVENIKKTSPS